MNNRNDVTIYHLAHALNLSPSTISRALNGSGRVRKQTRDRIKKVADDLGYRPNFFASRLKTQRSQLIAVTVTQLNNSTASSTITGAEMAASQKGYNIILKQSMNRPEVRLANYESLRTHSIDGLCVISSFFQEITPAALSNLEVPVVIVETSTMLPNLPKKQITDFENGYQLTQFLIDNGCKRIAYLSEGVDKNSNDELLAGYRQALTDSNLIEADKFVLISSDFENPWDELCRTLVSVNPFPDGVLITNKSMTALLYNNSDPALPENGFWLTCRKGSSTNHSQILGELGKIAVSLLISLAERRIDSDIPPLQNGHEMTKVQTETHI